MMIFSSLFSTYMRYRQGIPRCDTIFERGMFDPVTNPEGWQDGVAVTCFEPASHLIASSWFHLGTWGHQHLRPDYLFIHYRTGPALGAQASG
ncbi:MAG: hypothetical protein CM1200mP21_03220 [Candidatus Poseidoniales archaeon]|nr:MAG: hypothetical protein CM1200mP21_03220 [Candidatus Poseidoniales archaeon]